MHFHGFVICFVVISHLFIRLCSGVMLYLSYIVIFYIYIFMFISIVFMTLVFWIDQCRLIHVSLCICKRQGASSHLFFVNLEQPTSIFVLYT